MHKYSIRQQKTSVEYRSTPQIILVFFNCKPDCKKNVQWIGGIIATKPKSHYFVLQCNSIATHTYSNRQFKPNQAAPSKLLSVFFNCKPWVPYGDGKFKGTTWAQEQHIINVLE